MKYLETAIKANSLAPPGDEALSSSFFNSRICHLVTLAGLLLLAYLAFTGALSWITDSIGGSYLDSVNRSYIKSASRSATELLDVLSDSKTVLARLVSGKGGISFFLNIEVQWGQSLSAIHEMVNCAWFFALASLVQAKALDLFLGLGRLSMAPVLTLFFCLTGFWLGLRNRLPGIALGLSGMARYILFAALFVHLVIPLSVYGVAAVDHYLFQGHKKEIYENFFSLQSSLTKHDSETGLHRRVEGNIQHFKDNQTTLRNSTSSLADLTARHIALVIAEFLLPLILIYALSSLFLLLIRRLWATPECRK